MRKWRGTGRSRRKEIHKWDIFYKKSMFNKRKEMCKPHFLIERKLNKHWAESQ